LPLVAVVQARKHDFSLSLVGEGFPPGARNATNGGKGEGGESLLTRAYARSPLTARQTARVLSLNLPARSRSGFASAKAGGRARETDQQRVRGPG
jgi:hypothetical protein